MFGLSKMLKWLFFIVMLCWEMTTGVAGFSQSANGIPQNNTIPETAGHDRTMEMKFVISEQTQCLPDGKIETGITLVKRTSERVTVQVCKNMVSLTKKAWKVPACAAAKLKALFPNTHSLCSSGNYIFFIQRIIS